MVTHQAGRITETSQNILTRQGRILLQNIFDGIARTEEFKYRLNGDPRPSHDGPSVANGRVNDEVYVHNPTMTALAAPYSVVWDRLTWTACTPRAFA